MFVLRVMTYFMLLCYKHFSYFTSVIGQKLLPSGSLLVSKDYADSAKLHHNAAPQQPLTCENVDDMVKHLSKRGPIPDYHPVPAEIKEYIQQVAQEQNVECGAIYQCPEHPKEIQIIGISAPAMSDIITPTIKRFPGYSFSIIDCTDPRHHEEYGGNDIFTVSKSVWQSGRRDEVTKKPGCWWFSGYSHCGLILTERTGPAVSANPKDAYYVVVPAHLVLEEGLNEALLEPTNAKTLNQLRQEFQSGPSTTKYRLHTHNSSGEVYDLLSFAMFSYRHFHAGNISGCRYFQFTNDLALLRIDPKQLDVNDEIASQYGLIRLRNIVSAMKQKIFSLLWPTFAEQVIEIHDIFPLQYPNTLIEMARLGVRVIIGAGQIKGHLVPCGDPLSSDGRRWLYAIEFIVDWEFKKGDCGQALYVQDTRDGHLNPFGMLIGRSLRKHCCGQTIYRAVVLRQALDEIESYYADHVTKLRTIERPDNGDADGTEWMQNLWQNGEQISASATCMKSSIGNSESGESVEDSGVGASIQATH